VPGLTIELPEQKAQTAFNLRRWDELVNDPNLETIEGRIETDRHGNVIMTPPPAPSHGSYQSEIAHLLRTLMPTGRVMTECPLSTADGVRAADVAWASPERMRELGQRSCFPLAPEICVEIISPRDSESEIHEKLALYFDAGAREVWTCSKGGKMSFHAKSNPRALSASKLLPKFPKTVELS
jgi:Uma2 family endonuclease